MGDINLPKVLKSKLAFISSIGVYGTEEEIIHSANQDYGHLGYVQAIRAKVGEISRAIRETPAEERSNHADIDFIFWGQVGDDYGS